MVFFIRVSSEKRCHVVDRNERKYLVFVHIMSKEAAEKKSEKMHNFIQESLVLKLNQFQHVDKSTFGRNGTKKHTCMKFIETSKGDILNIFCDFYKVSPFSYATQKKYIVLCAKINWSCLSIKMGSRDATNSQTWCKIFEILLFPF